MGLRNPDKDKPKSTAQYLKETRTNAVCMLEDCNSPISTYEGPGSKILCRGHQLDCVEYGGFGKPERPHTFYRNWECVACKYDPREDPQFDDIDDEYHKLRCMRGVMHGDHIELKSRGGADTKENIQTLCCRCHMIKTYKEKDYLGNKSIG
jgi:hypothetical protein